MGETLQLPRIHVVGAAIVRGGRCLVTRRSPTMSAPLKWEFPGGKVKRGESPREALRREVREELGIEISVGELLGKGTGTVSRRIIELEVYASRWLEGSLELREHHELGWFKPDELEGLDWSDADWPILPAVKALLRCSS